MTVDLNRRDIQFHASVVDSVLPEHFRELYPDLVVFLEKYYEFLDSDQTIDFDQVIKQLLLTRDIQESRLSELNLLLKEIGMNVIPINYFKDPRSAARLLANFYRVKGSLFSAEGFFRAFYLSDAEIIYPKRVLFTVGESLIGPDDGFIIQDGRLYQIFSILIRSEIPIADWGDLYKMFVHPAGFYLGSEVTFISMASMLINPMPNVIEDEAATIITIISTSGEEMVASADMSGLAMDGGGIIYRYSMTRTLEPLAGATMEQVNQMYKTNASLFSSNSFRFDEGGARAMEMSNVAETFDQVNYPHYDGRRNRLIFTEQMDNAVWNPALVATTVNAAVAPDGTTTADKVIPTTVAGQHYIVQALGDVVAGESYTFSAYVKAAGYGWVQIAFGGNDIGGNTYLNVATGAFGSQNSITSRTVTNAGNGWWRVSITETAHSTGSSTFGSIWPTTGDGVFNFTGNGVDGNFVWGAQFEDGGALTQYQRVDSVFIP